MFKIMSPEDAVSLICDDDCIAINCFLTLSNPEVLHQALYERCCKTGSPKNVTLLCSAGFGGWNLTRFAEPYVLSGAVKRVIAGHYGSMPGTIQMAMENKIEAYNLPLGVLSHAIRACAGSNKGYLSQVGIGTFVDPRIHGPGINARSLAPLVSVVTIENNEFLYYKIPRINVALIKGSSVDSNGNITFEDEFVTADALSVAQNCKTNGGKVIVQVDRVTHIFSRPRNVIVPGILVDAVVVCEPSERLSASPTLSGDIHVPSTHMDYWMGKLSQNGNKHVSTDESSAKIIGQRGAKELKKGDIVNIGIGMPEKVGVSASALGILKDITLTVEAGGVGGLPAPGEEFGATIGADMICDMSSQFDFYDNGGLDICFMGALEIDRYGNVNAHALPNRFIGIGGFANITRATKTVVFCSTFRTKGLVAGQTGDRITILHEGELPKFKDKIYSISFSAEQALKNNQRVLYITERCVFELAPEGLRLKEVYPGIDKQTQIIDLLNFPVE